VALPALVALDPRTNAGSPAPPPEFAVIWQTFRAGRSAAAFSRCRRRYAFDWGPPGVAQHAAPASRPLDEVIHAQRPDPPSRCQPIPGAGLPLAGGRCSAAARSTTFAPPRGVRAKSTRANVKKLKTKSHILFPWVQDMARHEGLLDVYEDLIGPDILC